MSRHIRFVVVAFLFGGFCLGCFVEQGRLGAVIPAPSACPKPPASMQVPRPEGFPPIALVWENTVYPTKGLALVRFDQERPSPESTRAVQEPSGKGQTEQRIKQEDKPKTVEPGKEETQATTARRSKLPTPEVRVEPSETEKPSTSPQSTDVVPEEILRHSGIEIPAIDSSATARERSFYETAKKSVTQLYVDDSFDASSILALYEQMMTDAELAGIRKDWRQTLEKAIGRSESLQRAKLPIAALRRCLAKAQPTGDPNIFTSLDIPACRSAFAEIKKADAQAFSEEISVPLLGRRRVSDIEDICKRSHEVELRGRVFPAEEGSRTLRDLVRKAYSQTYQGRTVQKISIQEEGWDVPPGEKRRLLHAIVGVIRSRPFPEDACVMEEITLEQAQIGPKRFGRTICCTIHTSLPIACEQLKASPRKVTKP